MKARASGIGLLPDTSLLTLARDGDRAAFAELWYRHSAAGLRSARVLTAASEADDLVAEAFLRIYQQVTAGKGPTGPFRPYLYATIRHLAGRWASTEHDLTVDDFSLFEDPASAHDDAGSLDRALTAQAFLSLPARWQAVLWYTVVEGMDPREVSPILGLSAGSVAALSYRAKEGLRSAWLQAHVTDAASGECAWVRSHLGSHVRNGLSRRRSLRIREHLAACAACEDVAAHVTDVSSSLAVVLIPLVLGTTAAGAWWVSSTAGTSATAASTLPAAAMAATGHGTVAAGLSGTAASAVVGAAALASAVVFSVSVGPGTMTDAPAVAETAPAVAAATPNTPVRPDPLVGRDAPPTDGITVSPPAEETGTEISVPHATSPGPSADPGPSPASPTPTPTPAPTPTPSPSGLLEGDLPSVDVDVPGVASAHTHVTLNGIGLPGATVNVSAAGVLYGSVVVGEDGSWSITLDAPPEGFTHLEVSQTASGLLGSLLSLVPVVVNTVIPGLPIDVLGL